MTTNEPATSSIAAQERPRPSGTNGMSIAAACLGVIPVFAGLLGIIFGFIALRQIKERGGQRGRGNALTGIVAGFTWILLLVAGIAVALFAHASNSKVSDTISVAVGQCFTSPPGSSVGGITVVSCAKPHTDQAYAE